MARFRRVPPEDPRVREALAEPDEPGAELPPPEPLVAVPLPTLESKQGPTHQMQPLTTHQRQPQGHREELTPAAIEVGLLAAGQQVAQIARKQARAQVEPCQAL